MDFLRTTVIIQWNSWKKIADAWKKIPDPRNSQEYHQSFIGKKNTKSVKQSKIITYQPKTIENPNIVDIKYIITEHPKLHINYLRLWDKLKK